MVTRYQGRVTTGALEGAFAAILTPEGLLLEGPLGEQLHKVAVTRNTSSSSSSGFRSIVNQKCIKGNTVW